MAIVQGFLKVKNYMDTDAGAQLVSRWTDASTVTLGANTLDEASLSQFDNDLLFLGTVAEYNQALAEGKIVEGMYVYITDDNDYKENVPIVIDEELSSTSVNALMNKAVYKSLEDYLKVGKDYTVEQINALDTDLVGGDLYYIKSIKQIDGKIVAVADTLPKYESKPAEKDGTDVSLVTTGEKYKWNQAEENVQSDFSQSDTTADDYIKNKPTSKEESEGGAEISFVTTGEKYIWNRKVDSADGKGLSTNDYTTEEKNKLAGIAAGAEVNVQADWDVTDATSDAYIANKPTHLSGDIATSEKGTANGVATLDSEGKVPSAQLPSYVDDVLEFATKDDFPETGESGKIYVALDTNLTYRWGGTEYVEISPSLALGETSATAYAGDKGKKVTDDLASHVADKSNPHSVTAAQVGLDKVDNTSDADKPVSTATQTELDKKVDKVEGKGLSTNDYTTDEKTKLSGIAAGAEVNVQSDWNVTDTTSDAYINNKPTKLSDFTDDVVNGKYLPKQGDNLTEDFELSVSKVGALSVYPYGYDDAGNYLEDNTYIHSANIPVNGGGVLITFSNDNYASDTATTKILLFDSNGHRKSTYSSKEDFSKNPMSLYSDNGTSYAIVEIKADTELSVADAKDWVVTVDGEVVGDTTTAEFSVDGVNVKATNLALETSGSIESGNTYAVDGGTVYDSVNALDTRLDTIEGKESGWDAKYDKPTDGIGTTDLASGVTTSLGKADSSVQTIKIGGTEQTKTDGTVDLPAYPTTLPASDVKDWAKADTKPTYTASEVGALADTTTHLSGDIATSEKGSVNGVATLDANGLIPTSQLPSSVDEILEYDSKDAFPSEGEASKIYVAKDTNLTYRWSGTAYVEISPSIALGETTGTAYEGSKGKAVADSVNTHTSDSTIHVTSTEKTTWNNKVDKVDGKGLSTNDYTTDEKTKLSGIASGAEVNVQSDWSVTDTNSDAYIANKPSKLSDFTDDVVSGSYLPLSGGTLTGDEEIDGHILKVYTSKQTAANGSPVAKYQSSNITWDMNTKTGVLSYPVDSSYHPKSGTIALTSDIPDVSNTVTSDTVDDFESVSKATFDAGNLKANTEYIVEDDGTYTNLASIATTGALADATQDSSNRTVTDAEKATWNAKSDFDGKYSSLTGTPTHLSGDIATSEKGAASGVATLDTSGKVPTSQLPSYVDDVVEYDSYSAFPTTGETGKIYVAKDTNLTYRWSGSGYVEISPSLALGETSSTAYAGNKGKALADAMPYKIDSTTVDNFESVSKATFDAGNLKANAEYIVEDDAQYTNLASVATTGSYNDLLDKPSIPSVPTNVSAFTNDAGYLTTHQDISGKMDKTNPVGYGSMSVGDETSATGINSQSFGYGNISSGNCAHAEGNQTTASGACAHAEGSYTSAGIGDYAHAEGYATIASGSCSHAEGQETTATGYSSHASGLATSSGFNYQTTIGKYNNNQEEDLFEVGNGTLSATSNAFRVTSSGNAIAQNDVIAHDSDGNEVSMLNKMDKTNPVGYISMDVGIPAGTYYYSHSTATNGNYTLVLNEDNTVSISIGGGSPFTVGNTYYIIMYDYPAGSTERHSGMVVTITQQTYNSGFGSATGTYDGRHGVYFFPTVGKSYSFNGFTSDILTESFNGNTTHTSYPSYAFGIDNKANYYCAFAEGYKTTAAQKYSHSEGYGTAATGEASHAEGYQTQCVGIDTAVSRLGYNHSEGYKTTAYGQGTHAEGISTSAGQSTQQTLGSHAEGYGTTAQDQGGHAEGMYTLSQGIKNVSYYIGCNHVEGSYTSALGVYNHAEGCRTVAGVSGSSPSDAAMCAHSEGYYTTSNNFAAHAGGHYNAAMTTGGAVDNTTGTAFVIGNGTAADALSNAFSVQFDGTVKAANTITASTTADYAEFFEWIDENPDEEDRVGYFVTLDEDKIRKATNEDDYILGVVSGEPFVLGNGDCDVWNGMFLRDEFRRKKYEPAPKLEMVLDEDGIPTGEYKEVEGEYEGTRPVLNPDYDPTQPYVSRLERKEWAPVGMLGVLAVRHDGTATVNGYVTVNADGIATACQRTEENSYRVIKSKTDSVVEIIFR